MALLFLLFHPRMYVNSFLLISHQVLQQRRFALYKLERAVRLSNGMVSWRSVHEM
jgi:hypothetical protein